MKDIVELTRLYLNETPDSDDIELLNEFIGLRTGAIVTGLGKVKQYASKLDQEINSLRANLSDLRKSTPEDGPEKLADALETMGKLFWLQRKMGMSVPEVALISGHKDVRQLFRYTHLNPENVFKKYAAFSL